jgi:hypothetical protein
LWSKVREHFGRAGGRAKGVSQLKRQHTRVGSFMHTLTVRRRTASLIPSDLRGRSVSRYNTTARNPSSTRSFR